MSLGLELEQLQMRKTTGCAIWKYVPSLDLPVDEWIRLLRSSRVITRPIGGHYYNMSSIYRSVKYHYK